MKTISAELNSHLLEETTTLATCWKLTRRDGVNLGFTSHDRDLVIDAITYKAATGFTPSMIASSSNLAVDNLDVEGMLSGDAITETDIHAGLYDFAEIAIFQVNYDDLSQGKLRLRSGWLGEVSYGSNKFIAEVRGLTQKLTKTLGELFSPACRASLGDARCKVNLSTYTFTGAITSVTSNSVFKDTSRSETSGYFDYGVITFTSGANDGLAMEVKSFVDKTITLVMPMPFTLAVSNTYSISAGCDKTFETCIARFNNAINFRGEPHLPGIDKMLQTSSTRSDW